METHLNSKYYTIVEQSLPQPDSAAAFKMGKMIEKKQRHAILIKPGEKFTAYLRVSAQVEGAESGNCASEVVASLTEIYYRPELNPA